MASSPLVSVSVLLSLALLFLCVTGDPSDNGEGSQKPKLVYPRSFKMKELLLDVNLLLDQENAPPDAYEQKRLKAPPKMQAMMFTPAERTILTQLRIIFLTSGVTAGLGQGVLGSSLGLLLQTINLPVGAISLLPIVNENAGIWSPYERGDFFMTEGGDGAGEEIGNYERLLGVQMTGNSSLTFGQVVTTTHELEKEGSYFVDAGETRSITLQDMEQVLADMLLRAILSPASAKNLSPDGNRENSDDDVYAPRVMIVDIGGVTGDENTDFMLGAISRVRKSLKDQLDINNTIINEIKVPIEQRFCHIHTVAMPEVKQDSRDMIVPIVESIDGLDEKDINPDLLIVRTGNPVPNITTITGASLARRLSSETGIEEKNVFFVSNVKNDYQVPLYLLENNALYTVIKKLNLTYESSNILINEIRDIEQLRNMRAMHEKFIDKDSPILRIGLVGKYTLEPKSYTTVTKSIEYAAARLGYRAEVVLIEATFLEEKMRDSKTADAKFRLRAYNDHWKRLRSVNGTVVAGGAAGRGFDGLLAAFQYLRTHNVPTLGICLGMQHMAIEWARNVAGISDAGSRETKPDLPDDLAVIHEIPYYFPDGSSGGRVGGHDVFLTPGSLISRLYDNEILLHQRFAQKFGLNRDFRDRLRASGLDIVAFDQENEYDSIRSDVIENRRHRFYVGVQYHPEFLSDPLDPVRPFLAVVAAAAGRLPQLLKVNGKWPLLSDYADVNGTIFHDLGPVNDVGEYVIGV